MLLTCHPMNDSEKSKLYDPIMTLVGRLGWFIRIDQSPTPTVVGEGCVGQKRSVPANGPAGTDLTQYGKFM